MQNQIDENELQMQNQIDENELQMQNQIDEINNFMITESKTLSLIEIFEKI